MDVDECKRILESNESVWLDFKQEYPSNNVTLLHDILCLANTTYSGNRYLVFGVTDTKEICGVEGDANRKKSHHLQDYLVSANLNKSLPLELITYTHEQHEIDFIEIKNSSLKPFFLLKDKSKNGKCLRAGVIYSRQGDRNTGPTETAPESVIISLWKERLGLLLPPLDRLNVLLEDKESWITNPGERKSFYHKTYTEFTIHEGEILNNDFKEGWANSFPDPSAFSYEVLLKHNNTVLQRVVFVSCDGCRYQIPLPNMQEDVGYFLSKSSTPYKISNLYQQHSPLEEILLGRKIILTE